MISVQCTRTDSSTESVRHINIKVLGRQTYATPNPMSQIPVVQAYLVPDGSPGAVSSAVPMTGMNYPPAMAPASIEALDKLLIDHHWPAGLRRMLHQNTPLYHKRYFILDDSSSMMTNDGMKLIGQAANQKFYPCSRWSELTAAMRFHAELASHASVPTEFRFLNKGTPVKFGINCDNFAAFHALLAHLDSSPGGSTPLVQHINAVVHEILTSLPELRATGRKAVLIIASDGEASDGDVGAALAPLQHLPVWVVIRLCTNEDRVREYWNKVDSHLELEMDVLDDLQAEAEEIFRLNPWLTYGEPLHRLREWGVSVKEIDLLDEALLSADQMKAVCIKFFSKNSNIYINDIPEPGVNWGDFSNWILDQIGSEKIWNPQRGKISLWIDMKSLKQNYTNNGSAACVIM